MIQKGKRYIIKANTTGLDKIVIVTHIDGKWIEVKDMEYKSRTRIPKDRFEEFFEELEDGKESA